MYFIYAILKKNNNEKFNNHIRYSAKRLIFILPRPQIFNSVHPYQRHFQLLMKQNFLNNKYFRVINKGCAMNDIMPYLQKAKKILFGQFVIVSKLLNDISLSSENRSLRDFIFSLNHCRKPWSEEPLGKAGLFIIGVKMDGIFDLPSRPRTSR